MSVKGDLRDLVSVNGDTSSQWSVLCVIGYRSRYTRTRPETDRGNEPCNIDNRSRWVLTEVGL